MLRKWLIHFLEWLTGRELSPWHPPLPVALARYEQALRVLGTDDQALLHVLLARDQIE